MNKYSYSSIMMKNVVYKTYFDLTTDEFKNKFEDFRRLCNQKGLNSMGPITYVITQIDLQGKCNMEIYMPVDRAIRPSEELNYRTYFCMSMMLQGRIKTNRFIEEEIELLEDMNEFAKEKNLTFISSYFHTLRTNYNDEKAWIDVKARIYEN
ncbi:DUF5085 family protein [Staphylococcus sp. EZ-P03]|uniref:DUF5085 family protein n=1 Tax=Staphylococcus sp. EZ-P03 TaxID=2282739 RepID=UPI000DF75A44|nr:DUF5085 family protein [Staphylococcus sp. EZ-P03]